jgi:ClpP class serine protease
MNNYEKKNAQRVMAQVYGQPWLITEDGLSQIAAIADRQGDIEAVMVKRGEKPDNTSRITMRDNVAVLAIRGPIFRYANMFTEISGASSIAALAADFRTVLDDPAVKAIILNVDSPGGQVSGVNEFAQQIYDARGNKPIAAYVGNLSASAGYWLASAASTMVIDPTAMLGSLGVVIGTRKPEDGSMEIVSSRAPKKRLDPTTAAGQAEILTRADDIEAVFFAMAARNRGVGVNIIEADFGQGGILVGEKAVAAGMADRLGSLEGLIEELNAQVNPPRPAWPMRSTAAVAAHTKGVPDMNLEELKAKYPEASQAIFDEGQAAGKAKAVEEGGKLSAEAITDETTRVLGLAAVQFGPEQGEAFAAIVTTGVTVDQLKAIRGATPTPAAASSTQADMLAAITAAGAPNPGAGGDQRPGAKDFDALVAEHQAAHKSSKTAAMQAAMRQDPAAHKSWLAKQQVH